MYDFKTFAQMNLDLIFQGFDRSGAPSRPSWKMTGMRPSKAWPCIRW